MADKSGEAGARLGGRSTRLPGPGLPPPVPPSPSGPAPAPAAHNYTVFRVLLVGFMISVLLGTTLMMTGRYSRRASFPAGGPGVGRPQYPPLTTAPLPHRPQPYQPRRDPVMSGLPSEIFHTPARFERGGLVFATPSMDEGDLSREKLRWCGYEFYRVRALVEIDKLNPVDDPRLRVQFDLLVARCQNRRGERGALEGARRDGDSQKTGIILDTFREARLLEGYPWFSTVPFSDSGHPELIKEVQKGLMLLGYRPGRPDGVVGGVTAGAVMAFQKDAGLPQTGLIDMNLEALVRMATQVAAVDYFSKF